MEFHPLKTISQRAHLIRAIAQNRGKINDSSVDELMFYYARFALWVALPSVAFAYFLVGFTGDEFSQWAKKAILYVLGPGSVLSIWISYRGEMKHLLYAGVFFEAAVALSWTLCCIGSAALNPELNYYIVMPVMAPIIAGTIILFCLYPIQTIASNVVFYSIIIGFPLWYDPNAQEQYPAFVTFAGVTVTLWVFVFHITNITASLYETVAEKEVQQSELFKVQTIINDGLDAAIFGMICYDEDGSLILEQGISAYFPDGEAIETQEDLHQYLLANCGVDFNEEITNAVQVELLGRPIMITRKIAGTVTVYSCVDMTDRQDWEERALTAEKLGLVGQITSGVTHNYNNSLAIAINGIERIHRKGNEKMWDDHLELVFNALDQARQISKKLLTLSGPRSLNFEKIDIDENLSTMRPLLMAVGSDDITVTVESDVDVSIVTDRGELEAALLNLVINAKNAIRPGAGTIAIETRVEDERVVLSVADNGPGIPENVREQIFDPFFSTNKGLNASGMGLTTVKSFVEGSNGLVRVESQPGNTVFELWFPLDPNKMPKIDHEAMATTESVEAIRVEAILLVDDNVDLLEVMSDLIEHRGVTCHVADNAEEARSKMKEFDDIDAVFIDLSMPDISGIDLGEELMEINSDCRYYLLTGERLNERTERASKVGFRGVFFKPLRVGELLEAAVT